MRAGAFSRGGKTSEGKETLMHKIMVIDDEEELRQALEEQIGRAHV